MVLAGPGSGKTSVIVERTAYMINEGKIPASSILVVTFSRAAATEMKERFLKFVGQNRSEVTFGTFHGIFYGILKAAYHLSAANILSEEEKFSILREMTEKYGQEMAQEGDFIEEVAREISVVKGNCISPEHYYASCCSDEIFRDIFHGYKQALKAKRKLDFDDMILCCYELFSQRQDILNAWRRKFVYILVDEFQDINSLQYKILQMLAAPVNNLFIVGDDDQSIYHFRGARPEIMQQFRKDFSSCEIVYLGENYRSDYRIVQAATQVIEKNQTRYKKQLKAVSKEPGIVQMHTVKDEAEENECIIRRIREQYQAGIAYEKQAVLYRTNLQPRRLAYKLNQYNIPYTLSDALPNLFDHFAVRYVLDYMRIAMGDTSRATFLRIINKPSRYISRDALLEDPVDYDKLRFRLRNKESVVENLDKLMADVKMLRKLRPYPALNFIRNFIGYDTYIKDYAEYRQLDASEMYEVLDEFGYMIKDMESYAELFTFIDEYKEQLARQQEKNRMRKGVNLMTMHSAKGLEFDTVYILDAVEEITPYKKAKTAAELEEERRMFYVAMTRARHALHIYVPRTIAGKAKDKSRFVEDITWQKES